MADESTYVATKEQMALCVRQLIWFLGRSAKRKAIVFKYLPQDDTSKLIVSDDSDNELMISETLIDKASKKHLVPKLCETRSTARVNTLSALIPKHKCITQSLGDIQTESTVSDARIKAGSYLRMLQSSPFIVALVVAQHILSFTRLLTQALQHTDCDVIKACNDDNTCKTVIQKERSEAVFESLWGKMTALADRIDVQLEKPRTAIRMKHRSTAGDGNDTASRYFKVNVFCPFIDHCVAQLEQ
jgi:hypothetical protein